MRKTVWVVLVLVGMSGCSGSVSNADGGSGSSGGGSSVGGGSNTGGGSADAGPSDAGAGGNTGGGSVDAGTFDAGTLDGGDGSYPALPCEVHVGSGSGTFTIDSTTGDAGSVICLKGGTYTGGSILGVTNRVIQNDGALVTITGNVSIGNLSHVTLSGSGDSAHAYGFLFTGTNASMIIVGPNDNMVFHDLEAVGAGILLDAGHTNLMWVGDPSGFVLYKTLIDRIHLKQSNQLFQGNYGALNSYLNFASDVEMAHIIVEDSAGVGQSVVAAGGFFNYNAHHWTITGMNDVVQGSGDDRDVGVLSVFGNGSVSYFHRVGGWGWLVRNFGVTLGPDAGEFHCENNVDIGTEYYGSCEARTDNDAMDTYLVPGTLSTLNIFIRNNVSGHKLDLKGAYTTAIGLIPYLGPGTTATLTDNTGCDNANDYQDMNSLHFFDVASGTVIESNDQQLTSCAGVIDPITGQPL